MIKLTLTDGRKIWVSPAQIISVTEPGVSQAWHGVRANVKLLPKGESYEVRETVESILDEIGKAT